MAVSEKQKYSVALGRRLRALRESKKISIKDFEALDNSIDRHALSRIENGKTTPSAYTLFKICRALGVTLEKLFATIEGEMKD